MKEIDLLRKIAQSYRCLDLKVSRLLVAFLLMLVTAFLEMSGLSLLYPVVLAMGNNGEVMQRIFAHLNVLPPELLTFKMEIVILFGAVAILYLVKNIALYFTYRNNIDFAMYYYRHLVRGLYRAYVRKPVSEVRRDSSGTMTNIICIQSLRLVDGVIRPLLVAITEAILLVAIGALVSYVSPVLIAAVVLACGSASAAYYALLGKKAFRWGQARMHSSRVLQDLVNDTSAGISEIRIFNREDYLTEKVYGEALTETTMFRNQEMYQNGPRYLIETVFVITFVSCFGIMFLLGGSPSALLASFSVIAAASFRILPSMNRMLSSYSSFSFNVGTGLALMETITTADLLARSPAGPVSHSEASAPCGFRYLQLNDVSFTYAGSHSPVLRHATIRVDYGCRVGISGPSGSGKSTLIDLVAGLSSPSAGTVTVDGRSIGEDLGGWYATLGYVPQSPFIMPGTIRENVAFDSRAEWTDPEVWAVLERVGLRKAVAALPLGLESEVGERGSGLSGGQRQLLCLARALLRKPGVLLLDEPTAALDRKSEEMVLSAIQSLPRDTTIIMVSHKFQNFRGFDVVYACADGRVSELQRPESSDHLNRAAHGTSNTE